MGSDVYAFSCYMWNITAIRRVLRELLTARPEAYVILGGPQVMNHAATYVPAQSDMVAVCNGEGEITFREYLRQIASPEPDFGAVPGISFWDSGNLVTTERPDRIANLDAIPTPFSDRDIRAREVR